ncbi:conserved hypothetical protein [Mucor ambiguus]|uniref:DUF7082 domain-containing protein n=1 Tax=Mucor ambiguus TaxID=91626 RepID=A0A0C9LR34_9FUNG|nr:conserved hypothetical protein [Mucor ambiguus]
MSQSFDLPTTTSTTSTSDIPTRIENKWIPQPSTNLLKPPQIIEYGPLQGQAGDNFHVDLNSHNLDANTLRIAFNSCFTTCHCTLNTVTQIITLHTTVPSATMVACNDMSRIPIYIVVVQDEKILDSWFIGYFSYHLTRKRASTEFSPIDIHAVSEESKRPRSDPFSSMGYPAATANPTSSSPSPQQQPNYYSLSAHQQQQQQQQQHAPYVGLPPTQPSPRQQREFYDDPSMYTNSTSTNSNVAAAVAAAASVYNTSTATDPNQFQSYNPNYSPLSQQPQDSYMLPIMSSMSQPAPVAPPPPQPPQPAPSSTPTTATTATAPPIQMKPTMPLPISTTPIMSHSTVMASTHTNTASSAGAQQSSPTSNPFANLLNKANLIIEGDLADVLKDWSPEEWENQRRLVQFYRKQEGNEVTCRFETFHLPAEKSKQPDMNKIIVVSCIYWKEKNEYFVTSVDCIYLLEHLIGVKFTVEEKNRIRRNLEGYKPLTVSKLKPESAEFFKLIMGFPNPKPRNIEKDVKVFPWTTLGTALKKIISKYTASYSSTASVNYDILNTADS